MDDPHDRQPRPHSLWEFVLRRPLPLQRETMLFIVVSALDVVLTWMLLTRGGFYESNPIAAWFIDGWGRKGMVTFKFSMVAFICVVTHLIARWRPETARRVMIFAVVVVSAVVLYSSVLLAKSKAGLL